MTWLPPGTVETARLRLRRPVPSDAEGIFHAYARDPEVSRYLPWRPHRDVGEAEAHVERCIEGWNGSASRVYMIEQRDGGAAPIGSFDLRLGNRHGTTFGYALARAHWGRGLMTEVLSAMVPLALAAPGIYRVWAVCDAENRASARVMEKAGLSLEGRLRRWDLCPNIEAQPRDCLCYARVR